jgi:hypothetical protein
MVAAVCYMYFSYRPSIHIHWHITLSLYNHTASSSVAFDCWCCCFLSPCLLIVSLSILSNTLLAYLLILNPAALASVVTLDTHQLVATQGKGDQTKISRYQWPLVLLILGIYHHSTARRTEEGKKPKPNAHTEEPGHKQPSKCRATLIGNYCASTVCFRRFFYRGPSPFHLCYFTS